MNGTRKIPLNEETLEIAVLKIKELRHGIPSLIGRNLQAVYDTSIFSDEQSSSYKEKWANCRKEIYEKREISPRWRLLRSYRRKWGEKVDLSGNAKYTPLWEEAYYGDFIKSRWKSRSLKRINTKRNLNASRMSPKSAKRIKNV